METSATIKMKQEKDGIIISYDSGQEWKFDRNLTALNALCILLADTMAVRFDTTSMYSSEFEISLKVTRKD